MVLTEGPQPPAKLDQKAEARAAELEKGVGRMSGVSCNSCGERMWPPGERESASARALWR